MLVVRKGVENGEADSLLCLRIKQLLWRKAFSLPGLATVLAQSQTILSLSKAHI
jgi:hypothetical protein